MKPKLRTHTFEIGNLKCTILEEGCFKTILKSEFEKDKQVLLSEISLKKDSADSEIEIGFNFILIDNGSHKILVDAGKGNGLIVHALASIDLTPDDINYLVITHGDNDHMGGIHHFPNSKIVLPKKAYDMWTSETARSILIQEAYDALIRIFPEEMMQLSTQAKIKYGIETLPSLLPRLVLVKEEEAFLPGFKMFATPGHRGDHYSLEIKTEDHKMIILGDAIRHSFQLNHPELSSLYDSHPEEWAQSIKLINERDTRKKALYFGTHVTFPGLFTR